MHQLIGRPNCERIEGRCLSKNPPARSVSWFVLSVLSFNCLCDVYRTLQLGPVVRCVVRRGMQQVIEISGGYYGHHPLGLKVNSTSNSRCAGIQSFVSSNSPRPFEQDLIEHSPRPNISHRPNGVKRNRLHSQNTGMAVHPRKTSAHCTTLCSTGTK